MPGPIGKRERQKVEPFVSFDSYAPTTSRARSSNEYDVEAILDRKGKKFLIKWQGYPESEATWEPAQACVGCIDLLVSYLTAESSSKAAKVTKKTATKKVKKKQPAKDGKKKAAEGKKVDGIPKPRGRPPVTLCPFPTPCLHAAVAAPPTRSLLVASLGSSTVLIARRVHAGGKNLELD
jgi:hypothetical protein